MGENLSCPLRTAAFFSRYFSFSSKRLDSNGFLCFRVCSEYYFPLGAASSFILQSIHMRPIHPHVLVCFRPLAFHLLPSFPSVYLSLTRVLLLIDLMSSLHSLFVISTSSSYFCLPALNFCCDGTSHH